MANKVTTTFWKIRAMTTKIKVVQGGQAAGKNYAILQLLWEKALERKRLITVMTDTYDNLRDGAINDFKNLFWEAGLNWSDHYNKTDKELVIGPSIIQFRYISDNKLNAGKSKRRDILYINEGNKIGWTIAATYIGRTHEDVYVDHNPDFEYWAHTEIPQLTYPTGPLKGKRMDSMIIVTWRDNELCPPDEIAFIEARKHNKQWYRVYGMGLTGTYSDRRIYNFEWLDEMGKSVNGKLTEKEKAAMAQAKRIYSGLDFGQSPDPTILVDLYITGSTLIVDERFCENNLRPEDIAGDKRMSVLDKFEEIGFDKGWRVIGDTDGYDSMIDLNKHGYNTIAVKKLKGMQAEGIRKIRGYDIYITKRSANVKKGLESWMWKVDQNGKIVPEPDGHEPDGLAAMRYGVMTHINQ